MNADHIRTFTFDGTAVLGRIVQLRDAWQQIRNRGLQEPSAESMLGQLVAIVAMLAHGLKFDGSVILQMHGHGPVRMAMAECSDRKTLRAIVRGDGRVGTQQRTGRLAITLIPRRGEMYQGVVATESGSVSNAVEAYFDSSEQIPTRIWAAANGNAVAGMMLQRLPRTPDQDGSDHDEVAWQRIREMAGAVSEHALLNSPVPQLLATLFGDRAVRLHAPVDLQFGCSCSRERTANALRIIGRTEVDDIIRQEGRVDVTCEFCGQSYAYDAIDARLLFEPLIPPSSSSPQ